MNGDKNLFSTIQSFLRSSFVNPEPSSNDEKANYFNNYAGQLISVHGEVKERSVKLSRLLDDFIKQTRHRKLLNFWLRIITFFNIFVILDVFTYFLFLKVSNFAFDTPTVEAVISILTLVVGYVGSFIGALEIITKYLFPISEESDAVELLKVVVNNDQQIEEVMSKIAIGNLK